MESHYIDSFKTDHTSIYVSFQLQLIHCEFYSLYSAKNLNGLVQRKSVYSFEMGLKLFVEKIST